MSGRIMSRSIGSRRLKKSYTLSPQSVKFLETVRRKRRAASTSAVLEEILESLRRQHERASLERAVADYYSSLTVEDLAEQSEWADFALLEFPSAERS